MSYIGKGVEVVTFNTATTLDVAGNITVGGTVDGRDVATDGTKLDTIAANAIANLSEDTTPQLGGNLDLNTSNVIGTGNINVTGSITGTSFVSTGDMSFTNNSKAIFGTSPSLEIYHDGSNSILDDVGAGNFKMQLAGADKLEITSTGVDVTGTVTATAFSGDGSALTGITIPTLSSLGIANHNDITVDGSGNVGINGSPSEALEVHGTTPIIQINDRGLYQAQIGLIGNDLEIRGSSGSVEFYTGSADGASSTERLRIDSSGRVMIGTTTEGQVQAENLTIADSGNMGMTLRSTDSGETSIFFSDGTSGATEYAGWLQYAHSNDRMTFGTSATERMRIDSSGNVKIGDATTDVTSKLTVSGNGSADTATFMYDGSAGTYFDINTNAANGTVNLEANARSGAFPPLTFKTGGSEVGRWDASGNLLVGKTSVSTSTAGFEVRSDGLIYSGRDGNEPLILNRLTSDGNIVDLRKDGTTVGNIGVLGGIMDIDGGANLGVGAGDTGLLFTASSDDIRPFNVTTGSTRDAAINLGSSSRRFKDLYLSGSISDGTNSKTVADIVSGGGGLTSQQVFTSSGTWTKPAGISKVKVYVVGGGGGAQNVASTQAASGGGGGLSIALIDVSGISSASITIGAGGSGSSSSGSRGGNGGTSSFGSYASATGGEGGVSTLSPYDGGEGGIGTTSVTSPVLSALNTRGNGGSRTGGLNIQQSGGGSFFGGGGAGAHDTGSTASQGQAGTHGGGAGISQYTVAIPGGSGLVVIEEYA